MGGGGGGEAVYFYKDFLATTRIKWLGRDEGFYRGEGVCALQCAYVGMQCVYVCGIA